MNKLLLITTLLTATLSAEWVMVETSKGIFMYQTKTGMTYKYQEFKGEQFREVNFRGKDQAKSVPGMYWTPQGAFNSFYESEEKK